MRTGSVCLIGALVLGVGCTGTIGDRDLSSGRPGPGEPPQGGGSSGGQPPGGSGNQPDVGQPAAGHLRRLTASQFRRSLQDLLGTAAVLPEIEESPISAHLKSIGSSITALSPKGVEQFEAAIKTALDPLFTDASRRDAFAGCAPAAWDAACARKFLEGFGRRAWRRPLTQDEVTRYLKLGEEAATAPGVFTDGIHAMTSALLQSPNFLYRVEIGGEALPGKNYSRFTPHEVATRLSFLLWSTTPDAQLLSAADSGGLNTPEGIRKEAQRLLDSPRIVDGLHDLVDDVLSLGSIDMMVKEPSLFPQLTPTLRQALRSEILKLYEDVALKKDGDLMELFDTTRTFANQELGQLYGMNVSGTNMVEAQHPANIPRAGLLTAAGLMTVHDKQHETSPTRRGAFVRNVFLCQHIPDPPPNVDVTIKPPPPGVVLSRRELLNQHAVDDACSGCHRMMDPIGFALENFDAIGIYRTKEENGLPIDPSGELDGKPFAGPRELAALLRQSPEARDCMAKWVYRFATGREETKYDVSHIEQLGKSFAAAGQRLRPLMMSLVVSDGFLNVSLPGQK